ncbi:MAG: sporulation protein [Acidimicrobiia bacterium]|nr:sporulation protein [Acidimicrobiia bacterium]
MTATTDHSELAILDDLRGTRDALSVHRVFGDPCTIDGVAIIPVARIAGGGGGGGGGEGTGPDEAGGHGFGTGFGLGARPVGVYRIKDGDLTWKPAVDIDRLARGAQVLAGIATVCATLVALRSRR